MALKNLSAPWKNCSYLNLYWQEEAQLPFATLNCPKEYQGNNDKNEIKNENDIENNNKTESENEMQVLFYLVYFEDTRSLQHKIDYAKQLELAGIVTWALGYKRESRDSQDL